MSFTDQMRCAHSDIGAKALQAFDIARAIKAELGVYDKASGSLAAVAPNAAPPEGFFPVQLRQLRGIDGYLEDTLRDLKEVLEAVQGAEKAPEQPQEAGRPR